MKYLGLDLGSRTLGLAISDSLGMFARAYDTLRFEDDDYEYAINETINICKKEGINEIDLKLAMILKRKSRKNQILKCIFLMNDLQLLELIRL